MYRFLRLLKDFHVFCSLFIHLLIGRMFMLFLQCTRHCAEVQQGARPKWPRPSQSLWPVRRELYVITLNKLCWGLWGKIKVWEVIAWSSSWSGDQEKLLWRNTFEPRSGVSGQHTGESALSRGKSPLNSENNGKHWSSCGTGQEGVLEMTVIVSLIYGT